MPRLNIIDQLVYPADRPLIKDKFQTLLSCGIEQRAEARVIVQGEKELHWVTMVGRRVMIEGNPFIICTIQDITERKQEEASLAQKESNYRSITEHLDGVDFVVTTNSKLSYISPTTEHVFGYLPNEMQGESFVGFLEEKKEISETLAALHETALNHIPAQILELHFRRKNGSLFWGEVHLQHALKNGNPIIVGLLHDVTLRKNMEAHTLFRLGIFEKLERCSIEELIKAILHETARLTESSTAFCYVLADDQNGYPPYAFSINRDKTMSSENDNAELLTLNHTEYFAEVLQAQQTVIHNGGKTVKIRRKQSATQLKRSLFLPIMKGNRVAAIVGVGDKSCFYDEHDEEAVKFFGELVYDIVDRKRVDELENNLQMSLIQAQKMAHVCQFIIRLGGNYEYIMKSVQGTVKQILEQHEIGDPLKQNLATILDNIISYSHWLSQLFMYARGQAVMPIVLDLNILVQEMQHKLRELIGEQITLFWIPCRQTTQVKIDPSQIEQLLKILCINAREAISGNGQITIKTARIVITDNDCTEGHPSIPGNYVVLSVTDNGIGIEKKDFPHIFEPFFTTKEEGVGKGLGFGLSVAYGIVRQNQGHIDCQSEPGRGSTFTVYFRRNPDDNYFVEEETPLSIGQLKEKILLVEHEPELQAYYKRLLEKQGFNVYAASSSDEAIQLASEHQSEIDLLLTEAVLPEENGCDLSNRLHGICPNMKTLFMSSYDNELIARQGVLDEGDGYIWKPFFINELTIKVHELLTPVSVN